MTTFPKKEASIVSITMFLALAAVTPKCLAASLILNPVLAQSAPPHILHQHQKPGFLRLRQPESLDYSLINPVFQVLLRKVQDVSHLSLSSYPHL